MNTIYCDGGLFVIFSRSRREVLDEMNTGEEGRSRKEIIIGF